MLAFQAEVFALRRVISKVGASTLNEQPISEGCLLMEPIMDFYQVYCKRCGQNRRNNG